MTHTIEIKHNKFDLDDREAIVGPSGRVNGEYDSTNVDAAALEKELTKAVDGEIRFDRGSRALYATDASNYRQVPIGIVIPRTVSAAVKTIEICHRYGAPIVNRGGGTALGGQGCNVAVLIDFSKYLNRVLAIDAVNRIGEVEPGCVLDTLRLAAEQHHLTFGPDPATHDHNTLGGMLGNNSCGVHSVMAGRTSDNVESLDIITAEGIRMTVGPTSDDELGRILSGGGRRAEIYRHLIAFRDRYGDLIRARYPKIPRRVSGYENLDELLPEKGFNVARALIGTESTCVTILRARLNLIYSPPRRVLSIIGFDDIYKAADAVLEVLKFEPIGLEGIDQELVDFVKQKHYHPEDLEMLPSGGGWLVVEFGAETADEAGAKAEKLTQAFKAKGDDARTVKDPAKQAKLWELREAALAVTAHKPDTWPGWEDSAVPREALGVYLRELKQLFNRYGYDASVYGHFGDGLVHCSINFDLRTERGIRNWRSFLDGAAALVIKHGGSFSGEHGDGQARAELLEKMYGKELVQAFREFKAIWDPNGRMNPGKVVDPFPITSNLRMGPQYQPPEIKGTFAYPKDGSFTKAMMRCVGVGSCRRHDSSKSVMCPSFQATREERYSTRGRARLLFEMLHGGPIDDLWRSETVEEALDLCLACKGCKSDCPVNTDMATYKAEFRAHHYKGRLRPRAAYSMGHIADWSRFAGHVPWLANAMTQTPGVSAITKWLGGVSPQRSIPRYAPRTFVHWFRQRSKRRIEGPRVMLWPDTFNNYFRPETAIAATQSLEALGYQVAIPARPLCCGRPLYDWGLLNKARSLWDEILKALEPEIISGTPIIGLEPACVSAFRDELGSLLPGNARAERLAGQTLFISEFLDRECGDRLPRAPQSALVHMHCHHHAIIKSDAEKSVLEQMEVDHEILKSGCCGMAGSFGFELGKYDVSTAIGERVLLPRVRQASANTAILADGFSCREQIEQMTGRQTLHIAQLVSRAIATGESDRS
jgi:FAD/FMN-containing dehydrogenase/Fe-S oxidoreductase